MKKGRKSKYDVQVMPHLEIIAAWCRDGATEKDIAKKLGISLSTLNKYKAEIPEFSDTLKRNRELADVQVENALFNTVYLAYTAGKYGKECFDALRKIKGTFYLEPEPYKYTAGDLARARAKAMKVMEKYHPRG